MNCPNCAAAVDPAALTTPSRGEAAKAVLRDYRIWLAAFVVMLVAGVVSGALGIGSSGPTVGGGAAIGVLVATRLARARSCPNCAAVIFPPG